METTFGSERLRALVETGIAINSELSLDGVLERIVEAAAHVTDARYSALGVIDPGGAGLERFVTHGVDEETQTDRQPAARPRDPRRPDRGRSAAAPARPRRGPALGRLPAGTSSDAHFVGVPILLRGVAYGNLYLTEKEGGDFTDEDEDLLQLLARRRRSRSRTRGSTSRRRRGRSSSSP